MYNEHKKDSTYLQSLDSTTVIFLAFCTVNRTGELTNRLASDTTVIQSAVTENVSILARYSIQMLSSLGIMFWISAKLSAVLISVVPIVIIGAVQYGND